MLIPSRCIGVGPPLWLLDQLSEGDPTCKTAAQAEVVGLMKDEGVEVVDLRFCDLPGLMQHFSVPAHGLTEEGFSEGYGFDGSSIRGFQQIHESDMILLPDPSTTVIDPFRQHKTLNLNCSVHDPLTLEPYSRDPRYVAKKAEAHVKQDRGGRHPSYFGPEAEFFIFDDVRFGLEIPVPAKVSLLSVRICN